MEALGDTVKLGRFTHHDLSSAMHLRSYGCIFLRHLVELVDSGVDLFQAHGLLTRGSGNG